MSQPLPPMPVWGLAREIWSGVFRAGGEMLSLAWGAIFVATLIAVATTADWPATGLGWSFLSWVGSSLAYASARVAWARFILLRETAKSPGRLGSREVASAALSLLGELCIFPGSALILASGAQEEGSRLVMLAIGLPMMLIGMTFWARVRLGAVAVALGLSRPLAHALILTRGLGWRLLGLMGLCSIVPALAFLLLSVVAATTIGGGGSVLATVITFGLMAIVQVLWMMLDSAALAVAWREVIRRAGVSLGVVPDQNQDQDQDQDDG